MKRTTFDEGDLSQFGIFELPDEVFDTAGVRLERYATRAFLIHGGAAFKVQAMKPSRPIEIPLERFEQIKLGRMSVSDYIEDVNRDPRIFHSNPWRLVFAVTVFGVALGLSILLLKVLFGAIFA